MKINTVSLISILFVAVLLTQPMTTSACSLADPGRGREYRFYVRMSIFSSSGDNLTTFEFDDASFLADCSVRIHSEVINPAANEVVLKSNSFQITDAGLEELDFNYYVPKEIDQNGYYVLKDYANMSAYYLKTDDSILMITDLVDNRNDFVDLSPIDQLVTSDHYNLRVMIDASSSTVYKLSYNETDERIDGLVEYNFLTGQNSTYPLDIPANPNYLYSIINEDKSHINIIQDTGDSLHVINFDLNSLEQREFDYVGEFYYDGYYEKFSGFGNQLYVPMSDEVVIHDFDTNQTTTIDSRAEKVIALQDYFLVFKGNIGIHEHSGETTPIPFTMPILLLLAIPLLRAVWKRKS